MKLVSPIVPLLAAASLILGPVHANADFKLRGTIGQDMDIEMSLVRVGDKLSGSYFYVKRKTKIELKGDIDSSGNVILHEFSNGAETGKFKGKVDDTERFYPLHELCIVSRMSSVSIR